MVTNCEVCGKILAVMWPEFYVYRRGDRYFCSANCMMVADTNDMRERSGFVKEGKKVRGKITLEQKKKAVEIAMSGGDPEEYLKKCGSKNPVAYWWALKNKLKETDPEKYRQLMSKEDKEMIKDELEGFEAVDMDALPEVLEEAGKRNTEDPERAETRERSGQEEMNLELKTEDLASIADVKEMPMTIRIIPEGISISGIMTDIGGFDKKESFSTGKMMVRWNPDNGGEIIMTPNEWMKLAKKIPEVLAVMGFEN